MENNKEIHLNKKYISIDTETENNVPFIATSSRYIGSKIQSDLYDIKNENHYQKLKSICESSDYIKIFHAATYDIYALSLININVISPYHCTLVMASLINEHFQSKKLKELARAELGEKCEEEIALKKLKEKYKKKCKSKNKMFSYKMIPRNILYPYAIKDSIYTLKLFFKYKNIIKKEYLNIYNMERELVPVIVDMQKRGVVIDRQFCFKEKERIKQLMINEYNKIIKFAGFIPNINASNDIIKILKLSGAKLDKETEKGNISTDKFVMKNLVKQGNQIAKSIVVYKAYSKQISTYYNKLLYEYTSKKDSIAHFLFWQSGAKTGRFSADLIQTIPKDVKEEEKELFGVENNVRRVFIPRKGYVNFYFDYNQMEMRMYTHFSKDKKLLYCFTNNIDIHTDTAISLWGEEKVKNDLGYRRKAKDLNFGIVYGIGVAKLANILNIPTHEAVIVLYNYYCKYPTVKPFMKKIINYVCRTGILYNPVFKRKYHIKKEHAYKGLNVLVQGSCAYIIKKAMIKIYKYIKEQNIDATILLQEHDELVIEVSEKYFENNRIYNIINIIKGLMEDYKTFLIPITVEIEYTKTSWADKQKWIEK